MDNKFIAMAKKVCVVCGKEYESDEILIDKYLRDIPEDKRVTGYGMCPEHQKFADDGYLTCIEVDPSKSTQNNGHIKPEDAYRTGTIMHLKKEVAKEIFNCPITTDICFVEPDVVEMLQKIPVKG